MRAEIYIEDAEQGANVRFVFPDGFKAESAAHQLAQIIQAQLDALAANGTLTALTPLEQIGDEPVPSAQVIAG